VVVPIREELEWADLRLGRVTGADPGVNELYVRTLDERDETFRYDQLVISLGSVSRVLPIPGLAEHALGFKSLADGIALRNRVLLNLEIAESLPDDDSRREYLTFVFIGAGYAGVEGIAETCSIGSCPRSRRASPSSPPRSCGRVVSSCAPARASSIWTSARRCSRPGKRCQRARSAGRPG
jgi:hypothetical protein